MDKAGAPVRKRVVIVDDSSTMRAWLRVVIEQDVRLKVVGEAASAFEAREVIKRTTPDVLTLDVEMPGMDGIEFLSRLMRLRPMPVVMISGASHNHSAATVRALSLGAVDYILKPSISHAQADPLRIAGRVYTAACSTVNARQPLQSASVRTQWAEAKGPMPLIVIGASTGGVAALETVMAALDPHGPPVVVVQHMPEPFLISFSRQLDRILAQNVDLAQDGAVLTAGQIRLAPACGSHTHVVRRGELWSCRFLPGEANPLYCPSVDALFKSAIQFGPDVIAVILTGLGQDGAEGMVALNAKGAMTIGQDEASSVVYGMPRVAFERGGVQKQLDVGKIGQAVNDAVMTWHRTKGRRG